MESSNEIDIEADTISAAGFQRIAKELAYWAGQFGEIAEQMKAGKVSRLSGANTKTLVRSIGYIRNAVLAGQQAFHETVTGGSVADAVAKLTERVESEAARQGKRKKGD